MLIEKIDGTSDTNYSISKPAYYVVQEMFGEGELQTMMRNKIQILMLLFFVLLFSMASSLVYSRELALGVGYPQFLVKYYPLEVKYATGDGINVFAGRLYLNFYDNSKIRAFTGGEGGYIKFNTLDIKGSGYEGSIFIGGEYFVTDTIALAIDLSPTYISLKSEDDYKASGFEIVANASVYYYFSRQTSAKRADKAGEKKIDINKLSPGEKRALIEKFTNKATQYGSEGEYEKAIGAWKKVLKLDPNNTTAKEEIERAKAMMGDGG